MRVFLCGFESRAAFDLRKTCSCIFILSNVCESRFLPQRMTVNQQLSEDSPQLLGYRCKAFSKGGLLPIFFKKWTWGN